MTKDIIARRVAQELRDRQLANLVIGLPTLVAHHLPDGVKVFFQSENGLIGMLPLPEEGFAWEWAGRWIWWPVPSGSSSP